MGLKAGQFKNIFSKSKYQIFCRLDEDGLLWVKNSLMS